MKLLTFITYLSKNSPLDKIIHVLSIKKCACLVYSNVIILSEHFSVCPFMHIYRILSKDRVSTLNFLIAVLLTVQKFLASL